MIVALLAVACAAQHVNAQSSPPRPPQNAAPALLPPPAASPKPETVAPRTNAAAQVAPRATESAVRAAPLPLRPVSAPVESVRPAVTSTPAAQSVRETPHVDPPPPAPASRQSTLSAVASVSAPEGPPPVGATARCKDGTYLFVPTSKQSCSERGGLVVIFAARPVPPTPPRRP
jgi:hypothetical protein